MGMPTADYQYHALSATDSIRLLTVSRDESQPHGMLLSLAEARLADQPEYVALSYTWRLPEYADVWDRSDPGEGRTFEVACDGQLMRISENLFGFLGSALAVRGVGASTSSMSSSSSRLASRAARLLNGFPMWIDAFCIDQRNNGERQHQVLLMHRIYSSARDVVIWMGPSEPEAGILWIHDKFVPRLAKLTQEKPDFVARHLEKDPLCLSSEAALELGLDTCSRWATAWFSLVRFLKRRRWFDRGWVVQEITMTDPARALILCGTTALDWRRLAALSQFLHQSNWSVLLTKHYAQQIYPLFEAGPSPSLASILDPPISDGALPGARADAQQRHLDVGDKIRQISRIRSVLASTAGRTSMVDSAGKWHINAETAWFMCASLIASSLRSSQFGDDRDHLYGCLGMLSTLLPLGVSSPILPDYERSVEEVYISFSALVLGKTPSLFQLSRVESEVGRNYKGLPSWVPDYSAPAVRDPSWDRYLGITIDTSTHLEVLDSIQRNAWSGILRKPQCRGSSLFLYGTQLATVVNANGASASQGKAAVWNLVSETHKRLFDQPQSSFWDAVAAALLYEGFESCARADGDPANQLANERLTAVWHEMRIGNLASAEELCLASDEKLLKAIRMFGWPDDYWTHRTTLNGCGKMKFLARQLLKTISTDCINQDVLTDLRHRCLYTTYDHRLGLGPAAMALGDVGHNVIRNEVWLLEGARTPFILRRIPGGAHEGTGEDVNDCVTFSIVGETQLHGFDIQFSSLTLPENRHLFQQIRII
ncbi:hypothetical protein LZ32DRAFT_609586 [Colletotrichum eremochloae]|nr:hypothetical protein LZ32DRAFT_609586 [Colletotrichum eremochloae]